MPTRGRAVRAVAALVAAVLLAACTAEPDPVAPTPAPPVEEPVVSVGLTVGVVLPPADAFDERVRAQLEAEIGELEAVLGPDIRRIQTYTPPSGPFVADLVTALVERGTDLVCVLGGEARTVIASAAALHPELRYCAGPVTAEADEANITWVEMRTAELGHVLGVAARTVAGDAPVGVIIAGAGVHGSAFRNGVLAALTGLEVIEVVVSEQLRPGEAVERVVAEGAGVVIVDAVPDAVEALEAASGSAIVIGPAVLLDDAQVGARAVVGWRVDWQAVLRRPIDLLLEVDDPQAGSLGFAEQVFEISFGDASTSATRRAVTEAIDGLIDGTRDPLDPAPASLPAPSPPRRDAGADESADESANGTGEVADGEGDDLSADDLSADEGSAGGSDGLGADEQSDGEGADAG